VHLTQTYYSDYQSINVFTVKISVYTQIFVASFPYFNGTSSVYVYIHKSTEKKPGAHISMWARASLLFITDTNVYGTGPVKIMENAQQYIRGYTDIFTVLSIRRFLEKKRTKVSEL